MLQHRKKSGEEGVENYPPPRRNSMHVKPTPAHPPQKSRPSRAAAMAYSPGRGMFFFHFRWLLLPLRTRVAHHVTASIAGKRIDKDPY